LSKFTSKELAKSRGLKIDTIINHIKKAGKDGNFASNGTVKKFYFFAKFHTFTI